MEIFYLLLIILLVTRTFGEIAYRLGEPPLLGELIAGIALGVFAKAYASTFPFLIDLNENPVFISLANLGMFFLMLLGGVEFRYGELARMTKRSLIVGISGLLFPFIVGLGVSWMFIPDSQYKLIQCLFVGTAMAITAVPVSLSVLMQLNKLHTPTGNLIVSAAIIDDVLSLILLAFLTGLITTGSVPNIYEVGFLLFQILIFFVITLFFARAFVPRIAKWVKSLKTAELEFTALVLAALMFSILAEVLKLHWILGAFIAGLLFERKVAGKKTYDEVKKRIRGITTGFLAPVFFASIGINFDVQALTEIPLFLFLLVVTAFLTKLIGAAYPAYLLGMSKRDAIAVGVGMSARGAIELIIADIALKAGIFSVPVPIPPIVSNLFSAIVFVAIITTVVTPYALRKVYR